MIEGCRLRRQLTMPPTQHPTVCSISISSEPAPDPLRWRPTRQGRLRHSPPTGGGSKETPPKLTETDHMLSGDMVSSAWSRLTLFVLTRSSPFFVWCVGCSQSPPQKGLYKGDFPHWSKVKKAGLEVSKKLKRLNFPGTFLGLERL